MKELILIAIGAALVNNVVLSQFLGICAFLGVSKKMDTAAGMGGAVIFVLTISSFVTSLIYKFILAPAELDYLKTIVFILVIAALVQLVEMFLKKTIPSLYKALGVYLPLITTNCAVLGVAQLNVTEGYNLILSVVNGVRFYHCDDSDGRPAGKDGVQRYPGVIQRNANRSSYGYADVNGIYGIFRNDLGGMKR
mgnify:CR=1 FL=1